ncbi:arginase [Shigella sonnei]|uniref:arginase n=1 Tax=Shigella sonnei TaxID=624 RepID=UPI00311C9B66
MSPVPAGSGKSARPVPTGRGDTDHRQRLCRAASAGAVKRGARRHPLPEKKRAVARPSPSYFIRHNAPHCRLSTQVR